VDTFELLPTLAQGELAETSAPELVAAIFRSRASGTLWIETPQGAELRIYFRAGDMCGAAPPEQFHTLAHVLLANDWVSALDIDETREEAAASRKRHGEVLVAKGLLTPDQLHAALQAQHASNLAALLGISSGKYEWRGWEPPPAWARDIAGPGMGLVAALESDKHAARRTKVLDWLGKMAARLSPDWPDVGERLSFEAAEVRATSMLSQPRTAADMVRASGLEPMRAEALLATLLLMGAAEPTEPAAKAAKAPDDEVLDLILDPEPEGTASGFPEPELRAEEEDVVPLELDLAPKAQTHGVRLEQQQEPPPPRQGADEERARELRKKLLARGLRNLGVAPVRGGGSVESATEPEPLPPPPTPAQESAPMTAEERRLAADANDRLRQAPSQTAYARLGVSDNATTDVIKSAYLGAVKQFHPDRAHGGLASLKGDLERLFTLLRDAYENIGTRAARDRYDQSLRSGGAGAPGRGGSRKDEAAVTVKMADVLLKKRDFGGAIAKLRRAVELDGSGDALAALAWGLVADPKATPETKEEAASIINKALRADGATARTYYVAGVLWRTKDPDSAVDAFRKALEIEPNHADAALELRLIEQRRGKSAKAGGGVLSGLLFGKRKG
jgi:hypothetical protein